MNDFLQIQLRDAQGHPCDARAFYALDMALNPIWAEWHRPKQGELLCCSPKASPFALSLLWELDGFGEVMLIADNDGRGYVEGAEIDAATELTRTKLRMLHHQTATCRDAGFGLPSDLEQAIGEARRLFEAGRSAEALRAALWAGEALTLAFARWRIDALTPDQRAAVRFGTQGLLPPENESHGQLARRRFVELCDCAVVEVGKPAVKTGGSQNQWLWDSNDQVNWVRERGIEPLSYLFFMHSPLPGGEFWRFETVKQRMVDSCYETASRYRDQLKWWVPINEANKVNWYDFSIEQVVELVEACCEAVHAANPEAVCILNVHKPFGEQAIVRETSANIVTPFVFFELLQARGVQYDAIGLQLYNGDGDIWCRDLSEYARVLDKFAVFEKPIYITELGTPSSTAKNPAWSYRFQDLKILHAGWWHEPWNETIQADFLEGFFTLAAAHPLVRAIVYFDFIDPATQGHRNLVGTNSLLDLDYRPKESYHRLLDFVRQFRSGVRFQTEVAIMEQ